MKARYGLAKTATLTILEHHRLRDEVDALRREGVNHCEGGGRGGAEPGLGRGVDKIEAARLLEGPAPDERDQHRVGVDAQAEARLHIIAVATGVVQGVGGGQRPRLASTRNLAWAGVTVRVRGLGSRGGAGAGARLHAQLGGGLVPQQLGRLVVAQRRKWELLRPLRLEHRVGVAADVEAACMRCNAAGSVSLEVTPRPLAADPTGGLGPLLPRAEGSLKRSDAVRWAPVRWVAPARRPTISSKLGGGRVRSRRRPARRTGARRRRCRRRAGGGGCTRRSRGAC